MLKWQRFRDETPAPFLVGMWSKWPEANIGVICGTSVGRDLHVVVLDFDASDPDALDTLLRAAPASPMVKRGKVGESRFYVAPKTLRTASYDGPDGRLLDVLTGFDTRQTVVPPSIHPETMQPYEWLGGGPVAAVDLPVLTLEDIEALEEALEQCGWVRGGKKPARLMQELHESASKPDDEWSEVKTAALADLEAWVHDLPNLHGLRPARDGFEATDLTRSSGSGRSAVDRKRNLSIQRGIGIKDFGTGWTGSAIDLVARLVGCSDSAALIWLQERLDLSSNDDVVIDLMPHLAERAADDESDLPEPLRGLGPYTPPAAFVGVTEGAGLGGSEPLIETGLATTHGVSSELPAHLLDCPGLVGDIAEWMAQTAQRPLPGANLLTALSVVGTAGGRRVAGPTESGLVIFGLALAPSGSGKAHPIQAAQHLLRKAGLGHMVAPTSWMSGSALVQHLGRQPVCVSYADEVGEFFARLNGAKSSTHERAISGVLREVFGINWGSYTTPGWASSNSASTTPPVIHVPAYSFIGYSVPEAVWSAMQGADITNGFLNRFILMPTLLAGEECDFPDSMFDVSEDMVARLRSIAELGGPLAAATMHSGMATEPLVRVPWDGGKTGKAAALFKELRTYCREHPQGEHLMKRTAEIAIRIATIRAIGRDGGRAEVTLADMDWARGIALFSAERMIADTDAFMSETEWQQKCLGVLRIIREAPGGTLTKTQLYRRLNHKYPARDVKAITDGLRESGQVRENSARNGDRGPPAVTYTAV